MRLTARACSLQAWELPACFVSVLKEGNTADKRDRMREFLAANGYRNGHVTIDASDWYYDNRLRERLNIDPQFDVNRFRAPYLDHLWDRRSFTMVYPGKF